MEFPNPDPAFFGSETGLSYSERRLASAVIYRAVLDLSRAETRDSALKFFGGPHLEFWSLICGLDSSEIRSNIRARREIP